MSSTQSRKRILFLYSELAEYFLACLRELQTHPDLEIHVVRFKINAEAPFKLDLPIGIHFYNRDELTHAQLEALVQSISPSIIYCSGWIDKTYVRVCRTFKNKTILVMALDNPWKGTLRQRVLTWLPNFISSQFHYAWVPGQRQLSYAQKLGFENNRILTGVYSADFNFFKKLREVYRDEKLNNFPKRFLFVGRYIESKGVKELWKAFQLLQEEFPNEWELWCAGTGNLTIEFPVHPKIKNLGFVQPSKLAEIVRQTGVFVLPSRYEPWGVVMHEYASAGFPLLSSDEVGAAEFFLEDGINGFLFKHGDVFSLKEAMMKMCVLDSEKRNQMSIRSYQLAEAHSPVHWVQTLLSLLKPE